MTPMLGILASQITGHLSTNSFESIATVTVGSGGQSSISFTSIPSTYKHLQIRGISRLTTGNWQNVGMTFNSDTATNYSWHYLNGDPNTAGAGASTNETNMLIAQIPAASQTASVFNGMVCDILDYTNTNKYKTTRSLSGTDANGSGTIFFWSGSWRNTNAITSINLSSTNNFAQYSSFALYGVRG